MNTKFNYAIIGLFIIVLFAGLLSIFIWLSAFWDRQPYETYATHIDEAVSGLSTQNSVKFNGVNVGYVSHISLNPKDPQQVLVLMKIKKGTPITTSTVATLNTIGVTGVTYIELSLKNNQGQPLLKKPGEKYPIVRSEASLLDQLGTTLHEVTVGMRDLSASVHRILSSQNQQSFQESLVNIAKFTQVLAKNSKEIDSTLKSTQVSMKNISIARKNFPHITQELQKTLKSVQLSANQLSHASTRISSTMRSGQNMMQNISQQMVPSATETLNNLESLSANLQSLTRELQRNPSMIVRGKVPSPAGPGENK